MGAGMRPHFIFAARHGGSGAGAFIGAPRAFLQLCADQNMQVCVPTTPAQMFHMLRRQMLRPLRRPLVVMTPKSLLRHKSAVSTPADLSGGKFYAVLGDADSGLANKTTRVVLCSGKVYYDLLAQRRGNVAVVRIEQLHPFPRADLTAELAKYRRAEEVVWCQEEPKNQGAWHQINHELQACLSARQRLRYAGREALPSPAVGYYKLHLQQQQQLIAQAFGKWR